MKFPFISNDFLRKKFLPLFFLSKHSLPFIGTYSIPILPTTFATYYTFATLKHVYFQVKVTHCPIRPYNPLQHVHYLHKSMWSEWSTRKRTWEYFAIFKVVHRKMLVFLFHRQSSQNMKLITLYCYISINIVNYVLLENKPFITSGLDMCIFLFSFPPFQFFLHIDGKLIFLQYFH